MKQIFAFASFLLVASCASVPSSARSALVGDWRYADKIQSCRYSFEPSGTFTGEVTVRTKVVSRFTGLWSVKGDQLLYHYLSDALGRIPAGAIDRDKLIGIKEDSFLIEAADGSRRRYRRL
jgi:hypothetical protein